MNPERRPRWLGALVRRRSAVPTLKTLARRARRGDGAAQFLIANRYLHGQGAPRNIAEGARWLSRAAQGGHVEAQFLLAELHARGVCVPDAALFATRTQAEPDWDQACHWAAQAADAGHAGAQALLGHLLTTAPTDRIDPAAAATAEALFHRAACAGNPQGHLGLALVLLGRAATPECYPVIARHLAIAVSAGLGTAEYLLGELTAAGLGVAADPAKAADLYGRAAKKGVGAAQRRWGEAMIAGVGVDRDPVNGQSWIYRAALHGDAAAIGQMRELGREADDSDQGEPSIRLAQ